MGELADPHDLGSCAERRPGSTPGEATLDQETIMSKSIREKGGITSCRADLSKAKFVCGVYVPKLPLTPPMKDYACPGCGEISIFTKMDENKFEYGADNPVTLTVMVPLRFCKNCGVEFFDEEAEKIKDEAVRKHFGVN